MALWTEIEYNSDPKVVRATDTLYCGMPKKSGDKLARLELFVVCAEGNNLNTGSVSILAEAFLTASLTRLSRSTCNSSRQP